MDKVSSPLCTILPPRIFMGASQVLGGIINIFISINRDGNTGKKPLVEIHLLVGWESTKALVFTYFHNFQSSIIMKIFVLFVPLMLIIKMLSAQQALKPFPQHVKYF